MLCLFVYHAKGPVLSLVTCHAKCVMCHIDDITLAMPYQLCRPWFIIEVSGVTMSLPVVLNLAEVRPDRTKLKLVDSETTSK